MTNTGASGLIVRYLKPRLVPIVLLAFLVLVDAAAQLTLPGLLTLFVDNATTKTATGLLASIAIWYLGLSVARQFATSIQAYVAADVGMRATNKLRADLLKHAMGLDIAWHNATTPGALIERIDGDTSRLNTLLSTLLPQLIVNVLIMAGATIAFYVIDWRAGVLVTIVLPLALLFLQRLQTPITTAYAREREFASRLFGFIEERLAGTEDIRANGAVNHVMKRFFSASGAWAGPAMKANILGSLSWTVPSAINALISVLVVALGVWLVSIGSLTLGAVLALLRYTEVLSRPWFALGRQIQELLEAASSLTRINQLTALRPTIHDLGAKALPHSALSITFDHVGFAYPDGKEDVLSELSFEVQPGRILGLLGRTGSGKTTLTRLITRLHEHGAGNILLSGTRVNDLPLRHLRERVTLVTQDVQLFSATVRENVALFDPAISDDVIWLALERVGMRVWAEADPLRLDRVLTGIGNGMSAGQAQLLAFARAFTHDPGLVILDEASSRLDPATEQQLEYAIDRLLHRRTAIIIAHRLRTVERAHDILVLEDGKIVEFGDRMTLAGTPGTRYHALLNSGAEDLLA